jgi:hypothetical protein
MTSSTVVPLTKNAQRAFIEYYKSIQVRVDFNRASVRARYEVIDKAYQREVDITKEQIRAKAANKAGDPSRFQNMTVPVVMPQVETAVTYQTSVFLTGFPLFGVVAAPAYMDEAMQVETIIENDSILGGWGRHLMMSFRDGFKYNFAPLEVTWGREITYGLETNTSNNLKEATPVETIWAGNKVTRLDPYNTFVDESVPPTEVYKKGEYAGYTEPMTRIALKSFIAELPDKIVANLHDAFNSNSAGTGRTDAGSMNYFIPSINSDADTDTILSAIGSTNWLKWAGISTTTKNKSINYKDSYEVTTLYCKVLPAEFDQKVSNSNTPQIYKLIIINHTVIIYAELQTNAHAWLPILIGQPLEDGLSYQTKSLATNAIPFQELSSAYMDSIIASKRRAISDRTLYDPSRITSAAINSPNPSAKIPVRPAAYGKNIAESVYAFPFREDQSGNSMQQIQTLIGMSNQLAGQNQASQGQFVKGNKTLQEFDSVMSNANGRDQMTSILYESQVFTPLKRILKVNILQYQGGTEIYNRDKDRIVEVDPVALRKAVLEFKVTDGLTPAAKVINAESFAVALQVFGSSPGIAQEYNVGQMFSYLMKTQGAEIGAFEKSQGQIAYEQALGAWQNLASVAVEKGIDPKKLPPQPLPEQYGYNPEENKPAPKEQTGSPTSTQPPQLQ